MTPKSRAIVTVFSLFLLSTCSTTETSEEQTASGNHQDTPAAVANAYRNDVSRCPAVSTGNRFFTSSRVEDGHPPDQILWGQSTCVDDITNTINKLAYSKIKCPFSFGGLGGLPFTGIAGLNALRIMFLKKALHFCLSDRISGIPTVKDGERSFDTANIARAPVAVHWLRR
jgi:hypothetical protein